ncbi:MAG: hypothetical protein JJU35_06380 [Balneolales bacterium]|nr:hypothetical protein [Balneolales bacterium]
MSSAEKQSDFQFWSTAQLLAIGTLQRLRYNRSRYETEDSPLTPAEQLADLTAQLDALCLDLQSYRNLYQACEDSGDERLISGLFLLFQRIHNGWHRFHHELIGLPADRISGFIPEIDRQRSLWNPDAFDEAEADTSALPDALQVSTSLQQTIRLRDHFAEACGL